MKKDLRFKHGENFSTVVKLFADPRLETWRGQWAAWRVYEPNEGVENEGEAYVALLKTRHTEPGTPEVELFWSPMIREDLSGATVTFNIEGVYTYTPEFVGSSGEIIIKINPAAFATAPSSASYYLKVVTASGEADFPLQGTALFSNP